MKLIATALVMGALQAAPCPCPSEPACPQDLFKKDACAIGVTGEFLWWSVEENSLDYALKPRDVVLQSPSIGANGNYEIAKYDWSPGFRVGISYFNAPKGYEVIGQYTWLYSSGTNSTTSCAGSDKPVTGTFQSAVTPPLISAKSKISYKYNVADFMTAKIFLWDDNPHLRLKLLGGITGTWQEQDWEIDYATNASEKANIKHDWNYWGVGFRVGLAFDWYWFADFYLTGKYTTAALVGKYDYDLKNTSTSPYTHTEYKDTRLVFTHQFLLGPSYQKSFTSNRLEIFAGYELTIWDNLHEVFRTDYSDSGNNYKQTIINNGIVGFHGLTARITVDF